MLGGVVTVRVRRFQRSWLGYALDQQSTRERTRNGDTEAAPGRAPERKESSGRRAAEKDDHEALQENPDGAWSGGSQGGGAQARGYEGHGYRRRGHDGHRTAPRGREARN